MVGIGIGPKQGNPATAYRCWMLDSIAARGGEMTNAAATPPRVVVRDLGHMDYASALNLQRAVHATVIAARGQAGDGSGGTPLHLLLVEHDPPVITISRRPDARRHLVASDRQLQAAGVQVAETDRGGDITYHGPGQLVVYPIFDLNVLGLRLHGYMRFLEQVVIDLLRSYDIYGERDEGATGVWTQGGKVCAMGVRISRWVTMHGLALNVAPELAHFDLIVPCGLAGRSVTSMARLLGPRCPTMDAVKQAMAAAFQRAVTAQWSMSAGKPDAGCDANHG
jgi:lipoyl(octanoyl) transferase